MTINNDNEKWQFCQKKKKKLKIERPIILLYKNGISKKKKKNLPKKTSDNKDLLKKESIRKTLQQ